MRLNAAGACAAAFVMVLLLVGCGGGGRGGASSSDVASASKSEQVEVKGEFKLSNATFDRSDPSNRHSNYHSDGAGGCEGVGQYRWLNSTTPIVVYGYPDYSTLTTPHAHSREYEVARTHFGKGHSNHRRGGSGICFFPFHFTVTRGPQKVFDFGIGTKGGWVFRDFDTFKVPDYFESCIGDVAGC